jgi:hypothetical protein
VSRRKAPANSDSISISVLADIEIRVLEQVCRNGPYRSPVALAADVWLGHGDDWHLANADWIEWILYGLCDQGFVILREHPPHVHSAPTTESAYTYGLHISYARATNEAFDLLDFPAPKYPVGSRLATHRDAMLRPGDTTEFRYHDETAVGGEIERLHISEHLVVYPHHRRSKTGW